MSQTDTPVRILLAEDDVNLGYLLVENLKAKGFEVTLVHNGTDALQAISAEEPDLCIIDVMLPEMDGFSIAEALKKQRKHPPFIFLTARSQEQDKLMGFELGAEDFVTKPFSFKELYYRILVALRRTSSEQKAGADVIAFGGLTIDPNQRLLIINNVAKKISQREAGLLLILLQRKEHYVTRSEILKTIWGNDDFFTGKSLDVYVTRIRKLLKDCPEVEVENLYGTGYRIRTKKSFSI